MNTECIRIAGQLRNALEGDAWHGPPLREILEGITAVQALARPLATGHNIWELVLHIETYLSGAADAAEGREMPKIYQTPRDWREPHESGDRAWTTAVENLFGSGNRLASGIQLFPDERLHDIVPGRDYDFYYLFHGVVQHSLFHGGQIAMLKRAVQAS